MNEAAIDEMITAQEELEMANRGESIANLIEKARRLQRGYDDVNGMVDEGLEETDKNIADLIERAGLEANVDGIEGMENEGLEETDEKIAELIERVLEENEMRDEMEDEEYFEVEE